MHFFFLSSIAPRAPGIGVPVERADRRSIFFWCLVYFLDGLGFFNIRLLSGLNGNRELLDIGRLFIDGETEVFSNFELCFFF